MTETQLTEVREHIKNLLASDSTPRDEIIEDTLDYFIDEDPEFDEADKRLVAQITDEELSRYQTEQASWDGPTDCDLLDRAFGNLEKSGIVARQNFTCCTNCGLAEIGDDVNDINEKDGYVFYHMQDTERAVEGGGLYFSYGVFGGDETNSLAIGKRVIEALQSVGLKPDWDGTFQQKIYLPLHWKKRRDFAADTK